jgi:hypothetical protein
MKHKETVEFRDVNVLAYFECYGDIHLNYNSRKICKCIKIDESTACEIGGIVFNIRGIDTVITEKSIEEKLESIDARLLPEENLIEFMTTVLEKLEELHQQNKEMQRELSVIKEMVGTDYLDGPG